MCVLAPVCNGAACAHVWLCCRGGVRVAMVLAACTHVRPCGCGCVRWCTRYMRAHRLCIGSWHYTHAGPRRRILPWVVSKAKAYHGRARARCGKGVLETIVTLLVLWWAALQVLDQNALVVETVNAMTEVTSSSPCRLFLFDLVVSFGGSPNAHPHRV